VNRAGLRCRSAYFLTRDVIAGKARATIADETGKRRNQNWTNAQSDPLDASFHRACGLKTERSRRLSDA